MDNLITMTSPSPTSTTTKRSESATDWALLHLTHLSFKYVKSYANGEVDLATLTAAWEKSQAYAERLGYRLAIVNPTKPELVCVVAHRINHSNDRAVIQVFGFCRKCDQASVVYCCDQQWCEDCHEDHRREAHYD